jgi:hypothetical protein
MSFLDHTQRKTTVCRTPLDELSACHRDLYLTTHNNHNRQTSMTPLGFEPAISADERPQTYALNARPLGPAYMDLPVVKCKSNGERATTLKSDRRQHVVNNKSGQVPFKFAATECASFYRSTCGVFPEQTLTCQFEFKSYFHLPLKKF